MTDLWRKMETRINLIIVTQTSWQRIQWLDRMPNLDLKFWKPKTPICVLFKMSPEKKQLEPLSHMAGIGDFMSFTILGGMWTYLPRWPWMNISVALSSSGTCFQQLQNSQPHLYKPPCAWAHLHVHVCILAGARTRLHPSPPVVFSPSLKDWPRLVPLLRLIDPFIVRSVFTPRTVHQVTRQTLVKCGNPETFSLRDAMSISSTAIFHRKPKGTGVTTFSCGHKQWDYTNEGQRFLWKPRTLPWQPMKHNTWLMSQCLFLLTGMKL